MKYLLFICICIAAACTSQTGENNAPARADSLTYKYDSVKVYSKLAPRSQYPDDTAKAVISYPVFSDQKISRMIEEEIVNTIDQDRKYSDYNDLAASFITEFENYQKKETGSGALWFLEMHQRVSFNSARLLSILHTIFVFEGGAHPNTVYISYNIDPQNHRFLTIDSLLRPDRSNDFYSLAEDIFRQNEKLAPDQPLGEGYFFEGGKFKLPATFTVSKRGILFTYSPYEIKAYAAGKTELMITSDQLKDLVKDEYRSLLDR